ncbi:MAG: hypothetical protein ACR2KU_11510 [Gammaproteobacteria bacterium]
MAPPSPHLMMSKSPPTQTAPPISCGQPVTQTDGPRDFHYRLDLGNQPGIVEWEFEAYSIPDSLPIADSNERTLVTTDGLVSGFHSGSFNFPGVKQGTEVLFIAVNAPDPDTDWQITVGCPGQDPDARRTAGVHLGKDAVIEWYLDVLVDGRVEYSGSQNNIHAFTIQLSRGPGTAQRMGHDEYLSKRSEKSCAETH